MAAPDVTFSLLAGMQAADLTDDVEALRAEIYSGPLAGAQADSGRSARGFARQCRQPGFVLAAARSGGYLVGCAAGMPLRPSTSWWRDLTSPLPDQLTAEHPGHTFAIVEFLVRASWRRQGIGRYLIDLTLRGRPEERATVIVPPAAQAAQAAFRTWGWRRVGRTRDADPAAPAADILLSELTS